MNKLYSSIQKTYLEKTNNKFDEIVSLKEFEPKTEEFLQAVLNNVDGIKFKYELLMMPSWALKKEDKIYRVNNDYYTHIKIKKSII